MTCMLLLITTLTGCGREDYSHRDLGLQSKQADQVRTLIDKLTALPANGLGDYITEHGATELTHDQADALTMWLRQLQQAQAVELIALDRFGDQVYRVGVELTTANQTRQTFALLIEVNNTLKWAGPN